ncbi:MAG: DUF3299 domain-containing protein, partial [Bdellovibrionota bacterium]
ETAAEKRKKHAAPKDGSPLIIGIKELGNFDYDADKGGNIPDDVKKLSGTKIRVQGFMIPLEDTEGEVSEFLLVPVLTGCIHVPPPPPNQVIHVKMSSPIPYTWKPLWIAGKLEIASTPGGSAELRMAGTESAPYAGSGLRVED